MTERYALYFAPSPDTALANFGQAILGRTAVRPRSTQASASFADKTRWQALTKSPAHYGFHATLKAPFELKPDTPASALIESARAFACKQTPIPLEQLAPRRLSYFAALTLAQQTDAVSSLAQSVVETFEPFRQAMSDDDRQRRIEQSLSERQIDLLDRYGYPFVAEEFRFHMTLSGRMSNIDDDYIDWVQAQYTQMVKEVPILNRIAVYHQPDRQAAFVEVADCPFLR